MVTISRKVARAQRAVVVDGQIVHATLGKRLAVPLKVRGTMPRSLK